MGALLSYSLTSSLLLAAMYLIYKWLFASERQCGFNRAALWMIYAASFSAMPLYGLTHKLLSSPAPVNGAVMIEDFTATIITTDTAATPSLTWLAVTYLAGAAVALALTAITALRLARIIHSGTKIRQDGYTLVLTSDNGTAPFSWGRYMVMSRREYEQNPSLIILHERAHIQRMHWIDLIVAQVVAIFQWYNPAAWLMREEMKAMHEYQADDAVLRSGADARAYQMLLIKKAVGARFPSLANSLNHSKLKKRITMMYKQKSSGRQRILRAAALVPAVAAAVALFQVPQVAHAIEAVSEITITAPAEAAVKVATHSDSKVTIISANAEKSEAPAQAENTAKQLTTTLTITKDNAADGEEVYNMVEQMPEFPGGMQALMQYLSENIRFPENKDCVTGRVIVGFVVRSDGKVTDVKIIKSVGPEVDAEALRVVSTLPDFTPGKMAGKPVSVHYALAINFTVRGDDDAKTDTKTEAKTEAKPLTDTCHKNGNTQSIKVFVDGKEMPLDEVGKISTDNIASMTVDKPNNRIIITLK